VAKKKDPHQVFEVTSLVQKIQANLGQRGRVLVRPSGTENLIRVMVEGEKAPEISAYAEEIAECVRKNMAE
jgi:phosphoglucosamine mutase